MIWIILTFTFGWLLCGAWALRMAEKDDGIVEKSSINIVLFYVVGTAGLMRFWLGIWPPRLWRFAKGVVAVWKGAKNAD